MCLSSLLFSSHRHTAGARRRRQHGSIARLLLASPHLFVVAHFAFLPGMAICMTANAVRVTATPVKLPLITSIASVITRTHMVRALQLLQTGRCLHVYIERPSGGGFGAVYTDASHGRDLPFNPKVGECSY